MNLGNSSSDDSSLKRDQSHVDSPSLGQSRPSTRRKRGVVGVIIREQRLCIIRRSLTVTAPGCLCLPGGGIEKGETEAEALVREMQEELAIDVTPVRRCWRSVTSWGTNLAWWLADLDPSVQPVANPAEVAEIHWMTRDQIRSADGMLASLPAFMNALDGGDVDLTL
ncbi:NUDIX hydrolase [Planctomycetes bacterium K23_9]|uniref:Nudix hydrolase domain-containing protein n=1 Tax=Stieleria marina TaxID=1930275 RepID=A0A517NTJ9_9BACT|nr:hypothetical protein K239x_24070 [Planctomycetes bacterium K23_9]